MNVNILPRRGLAHTETTFWLNAKPTVQHQQPLRVASKALLAKCLLGLSCAAWLLSAVAHAQQSTPAPGGGTSIGNILGTSPSTGGGGAQQCTAPSGGATCDGSGPASQGNISGVNTGGGNPINLTNGNKYQLEVDLPALPGELGIEIVRHYNSAHRHVVGQLGMGWRLSYETDLYVVGQTVQILQADGARLIFNIDPQNPSLCAGADPAQGWVQIHTSARGVKSYVWHWTHGEHAGRQLRFDDSGKLVQIAAASGAVLSIIRGPKGELLRVTDPQGRSLSFNHGGLGRVRQAQQAQHQQQASSATDSTGGLVGNAPGVAVFTGIQSIDTPVGRFGYEHGAPASTTAPAGDQAASLARAQAANLTQVSLPTHVDTSQSAHAFANRPLSSSTLKRQYHFEDPRHPQALTGISVLGSGSDGQVINQRLATYQYNDRAQATLSVRGEPSSLSEQVKVHILQPALPGLSSPPGQTLLSNSLGQQTLYTHRIIAGQYRLLQAVGAGCAQCGPVNLRWGYDSLGRLIEQTRLSPVAVVDGKPQGTPQPLLSTRHTLDAQGRTQRIEQVAYVNGKAQAPQLIERHAYLDARWPDKPTLIAKPSVVPGLEHVIALSYNEAGQVTQLQQTGFSPLDVNGQVASTSAQASKIERSTRYTYTRINGRSLLTQVDGPLPNGPSASPADSDITTLQWDDKGRFVQSIHTPGGLHSDITQSASTGLVERVVNDAGFATSFAYNAQLQPTRISSQGPGWAQAQVQSVEYDALGHRVQSFQGDVTASSKTGNGSTARPTERLAFDAQGRLLWQASALGLLQTHQYDTEGQLLRSARLSSTIAQTLSTTYDQLGRPIGMRDNAGRSHSLRYGPDGLPAAYVDALGREHTAGNTAQSTARPATVPPAVPLRPLQFTDDFGRNVLTLSPDSGRTRRSFDAADRLVGMTDAQGNTARYEHDPQGRILQQTVTDAKTQAETLTEWRYSPRHLLEVIHPTQRERFETDARGLRTARIVTLRTPQGELTSVTRYEHDDTGQLVASTLPDGSRLLYERNGQGQVVALKRQTIQTPWLRWLGTAQTLASGFERDLVGLRSVTSGNGVQAQFQRSAQGDLARVVYRHTQPRAALQARHGNGTPLMGRSTQETIERLLGIAPAHAQAVPPVSPAASANQPDEQGQPTLPGALALPHDPQAFIDHRYLWSAGGHLLHSQQRAGSAAEQTQLSHAYNARGQLVASVQGSLGAPAHNSAGLNPVSLNKTRAHEQAQKEAQEQSVWRYAYDATQRRVLSQQGVASQSDASTDTRRSQFHGSSHRLNLGDQPTTYTANGQPERVGSREYVWDALGRLVEVREEARPVARYQYDHRGLRISKQVMSVRAEPASVRAEPVEALTTHTLYDESRQPLAELDAQGRITRQYIWLADMPLAVIDSPAGQALAPEAPGLTQLWADIRSALSSWLQSDAGLAWLHTNHLGAPEAATNAQGQIIWRARYAPFGAAHIESVHPEPFDKLRTGPVEGLTHAFTLNLRLPGQVFDPETGLHYNRQRYYDPELGQYLTPDPLGMPDGPNPYAYVAFNPLTNIDRDGLVLFAFDGTGNDLDSQTNVFHLAQSYSDRDEYFTASGQSAYQFRQFYIEGVGTRGGLGDNTITGGALALQMRGRIDEQLLRLDQYVIDRYRFYRDRNFRGAPISRDNPLEYDIDITGFSRGAASARDFANQIVSRENAGYFRGLRGIDGGCVRVNIRFMGLFDTVQSFTVGNFNLGLPEAVGFVAHAVARNEYRSQFPLESIEAGTSNTGFASNRIERAFVGAHSDVGGGYNGVGSRQGDGGDLSDVALNWMVQQAQAQGLQFNELPDELRVVSNPIVHDETIAGVFYNPSPTRDREVRYADGSRANGRQAPLEGMTHTEAVGLIQYAPCTSCPVNQVGRVDMPAYLQWLREHSADYGTINVRP